MAAAVNKGGGAAELRKITRHLVIRGPACRPSQSLGALVSRGTACGPSQSLGALVMQ